MLKAGKNATSTQSVHSQTSVVALGPVAPRIMTQMNQNAAQLPALWSGSDGFAALVPRLALSADELALPDPNTLDPKTDPIEPIVFDMPATKPASRRELSHNIDRTE